MPLHHARHGLLRPRRRERRRELQSHIVKPALLRMFTLRPEFTKDLISKISQPEHRQDSRVVMPELFVAYQLMSRLVDRRDPGVILRGEDKASYLVD